MVDSISAFGYTVPLVVVLVFIALVVGLALVVLFWLTVVWSIYRSIQTTRRQRVTDEIEDQLVERLFDTETDWDPWVRELNNVEREVVETVLDEYLRELDGKNVERLIDLGETLGIPERSAQLLEGGSEFDHLYALTWLALLDRGDVLQTVDFDPETSRERAAVARLRYESGEFDTEDTIALLLDDATSQFSVFGQDTLYRIALEEPGVLFSVATDNYQTWSVPLLVQVLVVTRHLGTNVTTEDLAWLTATLEHENEAVRVAGADALGNVGWRGDIRSEQFLDRLVVDPSHRVRRAAYETLARWGDDEAIQTLLTALRTEENSRARLAGTTVLARQRDELPETRSFEQAWNWSREHVEYDKTARRRELSG